MAGIKHSFQSAKSDSSDATLIRPSNWNEDHVIDGDVQFSGFNITTTGTAFSIILNSGVTPLEALALGDTFDGEAAAIFNFGSATNFPGIVIVGDDAATIGGPHLYTYANRSAPANGDLIGGWSPYANDSSGSPVSYGGFHWLVSDVTAGNRNCSGVFQVFVNNTLIDALVLGGSANFGQMVDVYSNRPSDGISITVDNDGASGPTLFFWHDSDSPQASSDTISAIISAGNNNSGGFVVYSQFDIAPTSVIAGNEGALAHFFLMNAGSLGTALELGPIDISHFYTRIGAGADTPITIDGGVGELQIATLNTTPWGGTFSRWQNNNSGFQMAFAKSRNASVGSHTVVQANDHILELYGYGSNGTDFVNASLYTQSVSAIVGADIEGKHEFYVNVDGSGIVLPLVTIEGGGLDITRHYNGGTGIEVTNTNTGANAFTSLYMASGTNAEGIVYASHVDNTGFALVAIDGNIIIRTDTDESILLQAAPSGTAPILCQVGGSTRVRIDTEGLKFNSDTAAANALDDYEEGTWSPTYVAAAGDFSSVTYDAITGGRYIKIGQFVHIQGTIQTDAITGGTAGDVRLGGLPFTAVTSSGSTQDGRSALSLGRVNSFLGDMPISAHILDNNTQAQLSYRTSVNGGVSFLQVSDMETGANGNLITFCGTYYTA